MGKGRKDHRLEYHQIPWAYIFVIAGAKIKYRLSKIQLIQILLTALFCVIGLAAVLAIYKGVSGLLENRPVKEKPAIVEVVIPKGEPGPHE